VVGCRAFPRPPTKRARPGRLHNRVGADRDGGAVYERTRRLLTRALASVSKPLAGPGKSRLFFDRIPSTSKFKTPVRPKDGRTVATPAAYSEPRLPQLRPVRARNVRPADTCGVRLPIIHLKAGLYFYVAHAVHVLKVAGAFSTGRRRIGRPRFDQTLLRRALVFHAAGNRVLTTQYNARALAHFVNVESWHGGRGRSEKGQCDHWRPHRLP